MYRNKHTNNVIDSVLMPCPEHRTRFHLLDRVIAAISRMFRRIMCAITLSNAPVISVWAHGKRQAKFSCNLRTLQIRCRHMIPLLVTSIHWKNILVPILFNPGYNRLKRSTENMCVRIYDITILWHRPSLWMS